MTILYINICSMTGMFQHLTSAFYIAYNSFLAYIHKESVRQLEAR